MPKTTCGWLHSTGPWQSRSEVGLFVNTHSRLNKNSCCCNVITQQDAFKTMLIICSSSCVIVIRFFQHWMLIGQLYSSWPEVHNIVVVLFSRRPFACWSVILLMLTHGIRTGRLRCMSLAANKALRCAEVIIPLLSSVNVSDRGGRHRPAPRCP